MTIWNGASRARRRVCGTVIVNSLKRLLLLAFVAVAIGAPRDAEATVFQWKNVDGDWDVAANWTYLGPLGQQGLGYPSRPGDQAWFNGVYTGGRTVTVPNGNIIAVGVMLFSNHGITIRRTGNGRIRMVKGPDAVVAVIRRSQSPASGVDTLAIPLELFGELLLDTGAQTPGQGAMIISGDISNDGGEFGITKRGTSHVRFQGNNSYLGTTSIESGMVMLDATDDISISGDVEIGSGLDDPGHVAELLVASSLKVSDTSRILVKGQGLLTVDVTERVGELVVQNGGHVTVRNPATTLTAESLSMVGGTVESRLGAVIQLASGRLTATSSPKESARIFRSTGNGLLRLAPAPTVIDVADGPLAPVDLMIEMPIGGLSGLRKIGAGSARFRAENTYQGETVVQEGTLELEPSGGPTIAKNLRIGHAATDAVVKLLKPNAIADTAAVSVGPEGTLEIITPTPEVIDTLEVIGGGFVEIDGSAMGAKLVARTLRMEGGWIAIRPGETLEVIESVTLTSRDQDSAFIDGGNFVPGNTRTIQVTDGPSVLDASIASKIIGGGADGLTKTGDGTLRISGTNTYGGPTTVSTGALYINGTQPASPVALNGGVLGGRGQAGPITAGAGAATLAPGLPPGLPIGRFSSGSIALAPATIFEVEVDDDDSDRLIVLGTVSLANARLKIVPGQDLRQDNSWMIIDNDETDPVTGAFLGLSEGSTVDMGNSRVYRITYRGGDGNDVVIVDMTPLTYYLAEGATGAFFDDDVLIANPNTSDAVATLTFLREGGATIVVERTIPARSRITVHVDEIEGLEEGSASVEVKTDPRLPLIVERTMFWDASYYGGHTANAVERPEKQWTFAEGFQGFFDTYILIANANGAPTTATLTFLRENDTPVVKTVDVGPFARKTVYAGDYEELSGRAFGIVVEATEPVIAERAMYFASQPGKLWAGGHVNTGIVEASQSWFHAEGATGTFFNTFILLSNPQATEANVDVRFLLANGEVITRTKKLAPQQRLTINPAAEGDPRLENAAVSTVVESDVPIVSERSMYWPGDASPLGEGHNSSGAQAAGPRWGLAEGRIGGDRQFDTFILLANPSDGVAQVRVTYLRENGAPIIKEYEVPATSRFNIDVKTDVPELINSSFGADIEVLNDTGVVVERSLYWNAAGAFWAGGTNALATPLRAVK